MKKFAALPPPGHEQWDNIEGNENMFEEEIEAQPIMQGIDNSIAHIRVRISTTAYLIMQGIDNSIAHIRVRISLLRPI